MLIEFQFFRFSFFIRVIFNVDYKKLRNELRKKATETAKLQKKCRKCKISERINSFNRFFFQNLIF